MKFIIAFTLLIAGISALPQAEDTSITNERIVTGQIIAAIDNFAQSIRDAGLDPLIIKREAREYALPVPVIFNAAGFIEDLLFTGLSDIRVHSMNYSVLTFRLTFDIELPHIHISAGQAVGEANIFEKKLTGAVSGGVDIDSIRVAGTVQVRVGIISGISVTSISIDFNLNAIDSYLNITFLDYDLSEIVNNFLGATIPNTLQSFSSEINELIEIILLDLINEIL